MNNLLIATLLLFALAGCEKDTDYEWEYKLDIKLINNSTDEISIKRADQTIHIINPGETYVYNHSQLHPGSSKEDKPSIDNIEPFFTDLFKYSSTENCDITIYSLSNHTNLKEISDLVFESTYEFNADTKEQSKPCE